jgi:tRNA(Ile2) C34 agmatinyltransferase TiaS
MRVRKEYQLICVDCGGDFTAYSTKGLRCPDCKADHLRRSKAAAQARYRSTNYVSPKARKMSPHLSIDEVLRQMETYNKENGKNLSYGEFVQILEGAR